MYTREQQALDNYITGHWGEDDADAPDDLAQQEAALIVEYMDVHGYSLEDARAAAAREVAEANEMRDEDWMTIE
jgi:hypothetical protein